MGQITCGYNNIRLIRKPYKDIPAGSNNQEQVAKMKVDKLGNFNLIPLESGSYYNIDNQIFPKSGDSGQIYLISDPDVGVLIPHIKKESGYTISYKSFDLDELPSKYTITDYLDRLKLATANLPINGSGANKGIKEKLSYEVTEFIFAQPIFLKNGSSWSVYSPLYKINDDDIVYEKFDVNNFNSLFETNDNLEINDVVISNKPIEDIKFSQFGIGNNGISLKNGLSYTISDTGDVNFNIGNIKSDTTPFSKIKLRVPIDGQYIVERKLETDTFRKGDVISGTSVTSLLCSIFQEIYEKLGDNVCVCSSYSSVDKSIEISSTMVSSFTGDGVVVRLKYKNTKTNPHFQYSITDGASSLNNYPIKYNGLTGNDLKSIPAGYYKVTFESAGTNSKWVFTKESNTLFEKINMLVKKSSNFDILIVKK